MNDCITLDAKGTVSRRPMQMEEFVIIVMEELKTRLGSNADVRVKEVRKNNGVILTGVSVFKQGQNIAPTVYLEKMLERYNSGDEFASVVDELVRLLSDMAMDHFDVSQFLEWEKAKDGICYKLINRKMNEKLFSDIPHRSFLDLEIVYYYKLQADKDGLASILIRNRFLEEWNVTEQELYEAAMNNTVLHNPYTVVSMQKMFRDMLFVDPKPRQEGDDTNWDELAREAEQMSELDSDDEMFVLTNKGKYFGAGCLLYKEVLKKIASRLNDDLIILPSSVHETILLRASMAGNISALKLMVEEVNRSQVEREERLSDNVYKYDRSSDKMSILMGDAEEILSEAV